MYTQAYFKLGSYGVASKDDKRVPCAECRNLHSPEGVGKSFCTHRNLLESFEVKEPDRMGCLFGKRKDAK